MAYSQEIVNYFAPLVMQLGSVDLLHALPKRTIFEAMTFQDDIIPLMDDRFKIEFKGLVGGYTVFDADFVEQHTVDDPEENTWGMDDRDVDFLVGRQRGSYFYITYNQANPEEKGGIAERMVLAIRI